MKTIIALFLILFSSIFVSTAWSQSGLELQIDSELYEIGEIVKISGNTHDTNISLQIKDPNGKTILIRTFSGDETFSFDLKLPDYFVLGTYEITASVTLDGLPNIETKNFDLVLAKETVTPVTAPVKSNQDEIIEMKDSEGGGCLIATAAYGSEMAPQVQFLREIRDSKVMTTQSGTAFMTGFNQFYYSFSPTVADYERENPVFKEAVKVTLTPMLTSLTLLNYVDIASEEEMLGYGIGIILLNIGMYFVAPTLVINIIKNRKRHC